MIWRSPPLPQVDLEELGDAVRIERDGRLGDEVARPITPKTICCAAPAVAAITQGVAASAVAAITEASAVAAITQYLGSQRYAASLLQRLSLTKRRTSSYTLLGDGRM